MPSSKTVRAVFLGLLLFGMVVGAGAADVKALITQAKAAIRAAENTSDPVVKNSKLDEARGLIDQIKAADPKNSELSILESKYRYLDKDRKPSGQTAAVPVAADPAKGKAVLDDWNAIVALDKDLSAKAGNFFAHASGLSYSKDQTEKVLSLIDDVMKNDKPRILSFLKEFSAKYGEPSDEMDKKIIALTPKDPKKGMYDEVNKRPDELPSQSYKRLLDRLSWIQENPKNEAKLIMKSAMEVIADIDFYQDTKREEKFNEVEAELARALRFNPKDTEISQAVSSVQARRKKSKADVQMALEAARFPANTASFAGPGKIPDLAAAVKTYYIAAYPKEKLLAVSVSGDWVVNKRNILDQAIQWGLPVYCASQQDEPGVCRVFKMTMLTGIGVGIAKAPPFTDHWTGDSFKMQVANLK